MTISAKVVADSINPAGVRLTTFECVVPKQILAQINTHGMTRGVAESSRARPTLGVVEQIREHPYRPERWNYRKRGMQPGGPMSPDDAAEMDRLEHRLRRITARILERMERLKPAKEDVNRYAEAWMYCTIVRTATEWQNYLNLRDHGAAQGPHAMLARAIRAAFSESVPVYRGGPTVLPAQQWHLPYVTEIERRDLNPTVLPMISAARCGRVSYGRQGETRGLDEDRDRALDFTEKGEWSPLDIPARAMPDDGWYGPLQGWLSLRKHYAGESGTVAHGCQEDIRPWAVRRHP